MHDLLMEGLDMVLVELRHSIPIVFVTLIRSHCTFVGGGEYEYLKMEREPLEGCWIGRA